ncbi:G-PROTEIN-RECEP-F1-2 domain-containing protein [Aphelenchoides bicaudatus]|nr:G-PROTEIN-RECEP-F1-2 domain-containing protein [Aphelenchoides bicaudatus]
MLKSYPSTPLYGCFLIHLTLALGETSGTTSSWFPVHFNNLAMALSTMDEIAVYNETAVDYELEYQEPPCQYSGSEFLEVKIYLIAIFAFLIAIFSLISNSFFVIVFILNASLRRSALFYFGILAVLDAFLAVNYILLMVVPVLMDFYESLPLYHIFLFSSVLLIITATVERLLRTIQSVKFDPMKHTMDNRPLMCAICLIVAFLYKLPTFFEIHYEEKNCTGFARYEIAAAHLAQNEDYRFWFMFVARNLVERIGPFFLLILLNFMIIRTLRRETQRFAKMDGSASCNDRLNKRSIRDATKTLVAVVTLYLASQSLQVFITFAEVFYRDFLDGEFNDVYSYLNDIISILTLTCSAVRFPVYMFCNRPIFIASIDALHRFSKMFCGSRHKKQLKSYQLQEGYISVPSDTVVLSISKSKNTNSTDLYMIRASLEDLEEQWMV